MHACQERDVVNFIEILHDLKPHSLEQIYHVYQKVVHPHPCGAFCLTYDLTVELFDTISEKIADNRAFKAMPAFTGGAIHPTVHASLQTKSMIIQRCIKDLLTCLHSPLKKLSPYSLGSGPEEEKSSPEMEKEFIAAIQKMAGDDVEREFEDAEDNTKVHMIDLLLEMEHRIFDDLLEDTVHALNDIEKTSA